MKFSQAVFSHIFEKKMTVDYSNITIIIKHPNDTA